MRSGGEKRVSLQMIAQLAGVSPTTVSFVINNRADKHKIAPRTVEKIRDIIRQCNYRPNFHGRALMARKTYLVGVIVHRFASSFWNRIVSGINAELGAAQFHVVLDESGSNPERERLAFDFMDSVGVDGFIMASSHLDDMAGSIVPPDYWYTRPLVGVLLPLQGLPSVFTDHAVGIGLIAARLWRSGHRKVAFLGPAVSGDCNRFRDERYRFFRDFYLAHGAGAVPAFSDIGVFADACRNFSAVLCFNDAWAARLLLELGARGIRVPDELSVAGYGGDENITPYLRPRLSTVIECKEQLGIVAARRLLAVINGTDDPDGRGPCRLSPELSEGDSIAEI